MKEFLQNVVLALQGGVSIKTVAMSLKVADVCIMQMFDSASELFRITTQEDYEWYRLNHECAVYSMNAIDFCHTYGRNTLISLCEGNTFRVKTNGNIIVTSFIKRRELARV